MEKPVKISRAGIMFLNWYNRKIGLAGMPQQIHRHQEEI